MRVNVEDCIVDMWLRSGCILSWEEVYAYEQRGRYVIVAGSSRLHTYQVLGIKEIDIIVISARLDLVSLISSYNLFNSLLESDKVKVIQEYIAYLKIKPKDKTESINRVKLCGQKFKLSGRTVSRYLCVSRLIDEWEISLDNKSISLRTAVELSYLDVNMQYVMYRMYKGRKLKYKEANRFRLLYS